MREADLLTDPTEKALAASIAEKVHKGFFGEAARQVNDHFQIGIKGIDDSPAKYLTPLQTYVHSLLDYGGAAEAAQILWTPTQFNPNPQSVKDIWALFDSDASMSLIMGAASMGKSFSMGVRLLLEFIRDPAYTTIKLIGPTETHLATNLFTHIVGLHRASTLPLPGEIGDLFVGLNRRDQLSSIRGVVIPVGQVKKSGRLQGVKRKPRPTPHPIFGPLSRLFVFLDEFENIPQGIFADLDNLLSQDDGTPGSFKVCGAFNPCAQFSEVGKRAEPPQGWSNFDPDVHFRWRSTRGWEVLRLDGERSENVVQGKIIYPGLQTKPGLEVIARNAGGLNSPGYCSQGRGMYPPQGAELTVIPAGMLQKVRGEFVWFDQPVAVGSLDTALEGNATACFTLGRWGRATGIIYPPSIEFPTGKRFMFKDRSGNSIVRWGLQATQQFEVPKGDTVAMKTATIELCRKAGVRPEFFAIDRTGNGAGVADLMKYEWGPSIHDVNFSEAASKDKIMLEDSKTCAESYERVCSELWFAMRSWMEFQYCLLAPSLEMVKLSQELTQRRFRTFGAKSRVESKHEYRSRGYDSPDHADSLMLLVHAARKGSGVTLSMKLDESSNLGDGLDNDSWWDDSLPQYKGGARIDHASQTDWLDENT